MENVRILIVENEPNFSDTLEMYLEELGYEIAGVAPNAEKALKIFQQEKPDLVLMDIHLNGEMSGIDLSHILKKETAYLPIIFLTSYNDDETFEKVKASIPSAFLVKPFEPILLKRTIELAIANLQENENVFENKNATILTKNVLYVKDKGKIFKIDKEEISHITVEDKYSFIFTKDGSRYITRKALKEIAEILDSPNFIQIHRAHIVNVKFVQEINTSDLLIKVNNTSLPFGRVYKDDFIKNIDFL